MVKNEIDRKISLTLKEKRKKSARTVDDGRNSSFFFFRKEISIKIENFQGKEYIQDR